MKLKINSPAILTTLCLISWVPRLSNILYEAIREIVKCFKGDLRIAEKILRSFEIAMKILKFFFSLLVRLFFGKRVNANGYVIIKSQAGEDRYEHRELAEEILGRSLKQWEVVHHINGRRTDNRCKNLCVMDHRDHDRYHEWYEWIFNKYGNYPRRETQLRKLREDFNGTLLIDFVNNRKRSA